jgi:hypothetical protein
VEVLGKIPVLGDVKLNPGFLGTDELEGPEVATKGGVCSSPEKSAVLEVWVTPNVCTEED